MKPCSWTILRGKIVIHSLESSILRGNPLDDPYTRDVIVYLPPDYSSSNSKGYVTVFFLAGFGGSGRSLLNFDPLGENIESKINRLFTEGKCGPMILVMVDCFTRFGGNQYINSSATGMYEDYITKEIVPFIDKNYNTSSRCTMGKSSGGYGAILLGMRNPDIFHGFVDHSGDAAFEYCYLPDFPRALETFRTHGNSPRKWLDAFWSRPNRHRKADEAALNVLAMAAHYSPNPNSELGVDLPFNTDTGELSYKVWNRWLEWDPAKLIERYSNNLRKLKLIFIDCGAKDEFNLQWGARIIHSRLDDLGIRHYYEEFDDGHSNISYRYDVSLPKIYSELSQQIC
jgi:S-formylglutathione hydrolase FrmB